MAMLLRADTTPLLEAVAANDAPRTIRETLRLLGERTLAPAKIAGRVGVTAMWGDANPHALSVLAVTGMVAEWMRAIPIGPEPGEDERRLYSAAYPLVQGFLAVASAVRAGLNAPETLPQPLEPADIKHPGGAHGALADAFAARDVTTIQQVLLGYYATGADYRVIQESLYITLRHRYPAGGFPLTFLLTASRVMDMAGWGDQMPALIHWYAPLLADQTPDTPAAQAARDYAADADHDLGWLRKRLAIPKDEFAGAQYREALFAGDATAACAATLAALRSGATPMGVAAGLALAAAERVNAAPTDDPAALLRAGQVLRYANAVHSATLHTQESRIWPLLYTAAAAVNELRAGAPAGPALMPTSASVPLGGGLIPAALLRTFEQQVANGDAPTALATARRYAQMGHAPRALAGALGMVAAQNDATGAPDALSGHALPMVAAAASEYLTLPVALQGGGQNALLTASVRLTADLRGDRALSGQIGDAVEAQVSASAGQ
ncbi:MAG TPA: hypothetical protein VMV29_07455 [Ktedonobacterales bacterium]|nr:hypothetical protein [Ktedonobacterales bacterium]